MADAPDDATEEFVDIDLAEALGAAATPSTQMLSVYVPNKDCEGKELGTQAQWVTEVAEVLAHMGGGVTIMPPVQGGWLNEQGRIIWEEPVVVYTYIKSDSFVRELPGLRHLLHAMGRQTNQGEIVVEFDHMFYRITQFDGSEPS